MPWDLFKKSDKPLLEQVDETIEKVSVGVKRQTKPPNQSQ